MADRAIKFTKDWRQFKAGETAMMGSGVADVIVRVKKAAEYCSKTTVKPSQAKKKAKPAKKKAKPNANDKIQDGTGDSTGGGAGQGIGAEGTLAGDPGE